MGYLTIMNGKSGQNGFSAVGFSILGQPPRYLWLVIEEDVSINKIINKLSTTDYDRLSKQGFNFNIIKRKKIARYKSLEGTKYHPGKEKKQKN